MEWTLLIAGVVACGDPVRDGAIDELGPEVRGVPRGPLHRPGQPCVLCHGATDNAPAFSFAGTVYVDAHSLTPIEGVRVDLVDSFGRKFFTTTNCAGNFFVRPGEYSPEAPLWVSLQRDQVLREMDTPIYREGSCAGCHDDPRRSESAGHVFLVDDPLAEKVSRSRCP